MSTATAAAPADAAPPKKGKKKLFIIIGIVVLVLGLGGSGAAVYMKKKADAAAAAAAEDGEGGAEPVEHAKAHKKDSKSPPTFVPLDPFTVNLADRDAERYAQVGVSLELADPKEADRIKNFMPVIRNNILMVLAHKTSAELLERDGKTKLANEIQRETAKALGVEFDIEDEEHADTPAKADDGTKPAAKAKKKKKKAAPELPVAAVHFSNFIIQ